MILEKAMTLNVQISENVVEKDSQESVELTTSLSTTVNNDFPAMASTNFPENTPSSTDPAYKKKETLKFMERRKIRQKTKYILDK